MGRTELRFGGSGGQGVVLAAQILGKAAILEGRNALQTQAYGAEARGSLTKSEVIISDDKILFPAARSIDVLVAMSQEAADRLAADVKSTGTLIVDSTNIPNLPKTEAKTITVPLTETAKRVSGGALVANMIMLGALVHLTGVVGADSTEEAIRVSVSGKSSEANIAAFRAGLSLNT